MNDIRQRLIAAFKAESGEHLEFIRNVLDTTSPNQFVGDVLTEVFRRAHSLKGAARAVDLPMVETLSHHLETLFAQFREGSRVPTVEHLTLVSKTLDEIEDHIGAGLTDQPVPESSSVITSLESLLAPSERPSKSQQAPESQQTTPINEQETQNSPLKIDPEKTFRIEAKHLDALLESTGQLQTSTLQHNLLGTDLKALAGQAQSLIETIKDPSSNNVGYTLCLQQAQSLATRLQKMAKMYRQTNWQMGQQMSQLQHNIQQARMISAGSIFEGFRKMMRDLSREAGKPTQVHITGLNVAADRLVLQMLKDPLMHLMRNALDHGLESPAERAKTNKPAEGRIALHIENTGTRLILRIEDDGRGINVQQVLAAAQKKGQHIGQTNDLPTLTSLIFQAGFSTREQVTNLSGRGMGLSVVAEAVKHLQGDVSIVKTDAQGTIFQISVPQTLTAHRLLLVKCGSNTFGIPLHGIARLYHTQEDHVQTIEGKPIFSHENTSLPIAHLHDLLGLPNAKTDTHHPSVAILSGAGDKAALIVDHFLHVRDAIVQTVDSNFANTFGVVGGIVLENGSVALVLNPSELVLATHQHQHQLSSPIMAEQTKPPTIMVVDDSITTRTLEKSILESQGYIVEVAVDGQEAYEKLKTSPVDLVVTDVEMPRLDGFGLVKKLKADPNLAHIPVIIVTSLQNDTDRQRGLESGAEAYVVKQKFDQQDLLNTITRFV